MKKTVKRRLQILTVLFSLAVFSFARFIPACAEESTETESEAAAQSALSGGVVPVTWEVTPEHPMIDSDEARALYKQIRKRKSALHSQRTGSLMPFPPITRNCTAIPLISIPRSAKRLEKKRRNGS